MNSTASPSADNATVLEVIPSTPPVNNRVSVETVPQAWSTEKQEECTENEQVGPSSSTVMKSSVPNTDHTIPSTVTVPNGNAVPDTEKDISVRVR